MDTSAPTETCQLQTRVTYNAVLRESTLYFDDEQVYHLHLIKGGPAVIEYAGGELRIGQDTAVCFPAGRKHHMVIPRGGLVQLVSANFSLQETSNQFAVQSPPDYLRLPLSSIEIASPEVGMLFSEHAIGYRRQASILDEVLAKHVVPHLQSGHRLPASAKVSVPDSRGNRTVSFERYGRDLLRSLRARIPFDLWMITRTQNDDWTVLQTEDHGYGVAAGTVFRWSDSFCSEMVKGNGPCIAPNADRVPAYAAAPIGGQIQIGSYIGMPIRLGDGRLFGTLCAIHPSSFPVQLNMEERFLQLQVDALSEALELDLSTSEDDRRKEREHAGRDAILQVYSSDAWDSLSATEEDRCRRFGHQAAVLMIDPVTKAQEHHAAAQAASRKLMIKAARTLRKLAGNNDIVARIGDSELSMLAVECDPFQANSLRNRIASAFAEDGVDAVVALSLRNPQDGIHGAWQEAKKCLDVDVHRLRVSVS